MKIKIEENENGEGFLQFEPETEDEEAIVEAYEQIVAFNLVFDVEDDKLVIYIQPNNIDLGYN